MAAIAVILYIVYDLSYKGGFKAEAGESLIRAHSAIEGFYHIENRYPSQDEIHEVALVFLEAKSRHWNISYVAGDGTYQLNVRTEKFEYDLSPKKLLCRTTHSSDSWDLLMDFGGVEK